MPSKAKARYSLEEVFLLIDQQKYWFSARSRSLFPVVRALEGRGRKVTLEEAGSFILRGIKKLEACNYVESILQWNDPKCIADVYGLIFEDLSWYVKFRIDREEGILEEISFHPPERDLVTVEGMKIPKGESFS